MLVRIQPEEQIGQVAINWLERVVVSHRVVGSSPTLSAKLNKMKTTNADMQRLYDYMDKMGVTYTVNRNPSPEEIARIKKAIEKNKQLGIW